MLELINPGISICGSLANGGDTPLLRKRTPIATTDRIAAKEKMVLPIFESDGGARRDDCCFELMKKSFLLLETLTFVLSSFLVFAYESSCVVKNG